MLVIFYRILNRLQQLDTCH